MSICLFFQSALPLAGTRAKIVEAQQKHGDILKYFWISEGGETSRRAKEDAAEYGFDARSDFMIQWNKEHSELIQLIPKIFYEVFGNDKILVRNNDYEVIPPP